MTDHGHIVEVLKAAGHDEAAAVVEHVEAEAAKADLARKVPGETNPAGIRVVSDDRVDPTGAQRRDGEAMLEGLRNAGILNPPISAGSLFGGNR